VEKDGTTITSEYIPQLRIAIRTPAAYLKMRIGIREQLALLVLLTSLICLAVISIATVGLRQLSIVDGHKLNAHLVDQ
jgi:hypothetical protein